MTVKPERFQEFKIRLPVPKYYPVRRAESQLGQLIRWACWLQKVPLKDLSAELQFTQPTLWENMKPGGASGNFLLNLQAWIHGVFGVDVGVETLDDLAQKRPTLQDRTWRQTAELLRKKLESRLPKKRSKRKDDERRQQAEDPGDQGVGDGDGAGLPGEDPGPPREVAGLPDDGGPVAADRDGAGGDPWA